MPKSAIRALMVLELMASHRQGVKAKQIEEHLDAPQSSTFYLLDALVREGYLVFDKTRRKYYLSTRSKILSSQLDGELLSSRLYSSVAKLAESLWERTGETIILACPADLFSVRYFYKKDSLKSIQLSIPQGVVRDVGEAACGIAVAQQYDDVLIDSIAKKILIVGGEQASASFMKNIAFCREHGYYMSHGQFTDGAGVISFPLAVERQPISIGVGGPVERIHTNRSQIIDQFNECQASLGLNAH